MTDKLFMGIDGGGTGMRIAIADFNLKVERVVETKPANPNLIGSEVAKQLIQRSIAQALQETGRRPEDIAAVAIGISGASNEHSCAWLIDTLAGVFPDSLLTPSSDLEIALVGALAQRHGILALSGTGSAVLGITPDGRRLRIGGWGYLLGDAGSAYWIGMQALREITEHHDQAHTTEFASSLTDLDKQILDELALARPRDLVAWLYRGQEPAPARVAGLARIVLQRAEYGDYQAVSILQRASHHLAEATQLLRQRLDYADAPIAFAGGLLERPNYLSEDLTRRLRLRERPIAKHRPVVGAALLARMEWQRANA